MSTRRRWACRLAGLFVVVPLAGLLGCLGPTEEPTSESREAIEVLPRGYSRVPSYPGEPCMLKRVCRMITYGPGRGDWLWHCESECLYRYIPKPIPMLPPPTGP